MLEITRPTNSHINTSKHLILVKNIRTKKSSAHSLKLSLRVIVCPPGKFYRRLIFFVNANFIKIKNWDLDYNSSKVQVKNYKLIVSLIMSMEWRIRSCFSKQNLTLLIFRFTLVYEQNHTHLWAKARKSLLYYYLHIVFTF